MAESASSEGELHVSRCHCETGRQRHRVPRSIQIPFDTSDPIVIPNQDHDSQDETNSDGGSSHDDTDWDIAEQEAMQAADGAMLEVEAVDDVDLLQGLDLEDFGEDDPGAIQAILAEQDDSSDSEGLPRIAKWRLNLTALSQVYNIYMVAYENRIHISRPRSCITNALPAEPDLILQPPASAMSFHIGGYLDEHFPHQVNHLIVGELGQEEVLLLAFDDGDAIGYYTRHIENEIIRRERGEQTDGSVPEPFFHENVGNSAWGLAVHKQSRIIAVSSNLHNVSVFVFALTGASYKHAKGADSVELFRNIVKDENGRILDLRKGSAHATAADKKKCKVLEDLIRHRDANWRIVLETGRMGTNIPNVAFSDDQYGEADKVVAIDIHGVVWLMDIWHFCGHPHVKIESLHGFRYYRNPRGWGVLVLPESSFLPTKNYKDSLGLSPKEARYVTGDDIGRWIDISKGIKYLKNNSTTHPWMRSGNRNRFAINLHEHGFRHHPEQNWSTHAHVAREPPASDIDEDRFFSAREIPSLRTYNWKPDPLKKRVLADGSSIMRTYELDIELRSFEEDGYGIMFEKAIDQFRPPHTVLPSMRQSHERLANLLHVPELSLVVAGSMCGRVALVTLTRPREDIYSFSRGFKIEAILPTKYDEDSNVRPICPLLGVAVAPVPFSGNTDLADGPIGRRRYRLMLHYYDLRILSYELSRNSENDNLTIF